MINGFEEQTHGLTEFELKELIPILVKGFSKRVGKDKAITNGAIIKILRNTYGLKNISEPRIRKAIHYIRDNRLVPKLIASSNGYWVATSQKEMQEWADSLRGRINAIKNILDYAEMELKDWNQ
jgi:heptaprenylglyceryl phosphate synthase